MTTSNPGVPVKYTGRETPFIDRLYGSSLPFNPDQTRVLTDLDLAAKLLRHSDVFVRGEDVAPAPVPAAGSDDTDALLQDADKNKKTLQEIENLRMDLVESLNAMDKDALQAFALEKFNQKVPKNLSPDNMRAKVVELLDQFGAP